MNIDLTNREIELLMMCVGTNIETIKRRHDPIDPITADLVEELFELETDLREMLHRPDDGRRAATEDAIIASLQIDPDDPDLLMDPVDFAAKHELTGSVNHDRHIAETQMFNAGVDAREKLKATATSRAQDRRTFNVKRSRDSRRSETQAHDVWDDSDPRNW
jgi:hypothetical protein